MSRSGSMNLALLVSVSLFVSATSASKQVLTIGGIFTTANSTEEGALRLAVDVINNNSAILPNHEIRYIGVHAPLTATFANIQKLCKLFGEGVTSIIGPMSSSAVRALHPLSLGLNIPLISPSATDPLLVPYKYLLRLQPPDSMQSRALVDFIKYFRWDTVAILTDNTDYGINGMVEFQKLASENKWRVLSVQQFTATSGAVPVDASQQLKRIKNTGARIVLLNTYAEMAEEVLEQAHTLDMLGAGWVWIVTDGSTAPNLLPEAVTTKPYLEGVLGTRPVTYSGDLYDDFHNLWSLADPSIYYGAGNTFGTPEPISAYPAAYYDAVHIYAHALHSLVEGQGMNITSSGIGCWNKSSTPWTYGASVNEALRKVDEPGITGRLQFDDYGSPSSASYDLVRLSPSGWEKHGVWSDSSGLLLPNVTLVNSFQDMPAVDIRDYVGDLVNKTLRVVTIVDPPFVFYDSNLTVNDEICSGNDCFYGYSIDLLVELASKLQFNYDLHIVPDRRYGKLDEQTRTWDGMVAELLPDSSGYMRADMAVGAFTVSYERETVISFTKPYRDIQLGILLGTSPLEQYNPWSFLTPLSNELWGLIIGTAVVVSVVISLLDKLSPFGHHGKKAQIEHENEQEAMDVNEDGTVDYWEMKEWKQEKDTMTWHNAMLYAFASLFEQGGESHPKSWSARVAAGAWWFGALILVQSYTANLAAFLTIHVSSDYISMVEDLAAQTSIKYGTIEGSQVQVYFDEATRSHLVKMANNMREWDSNYENSQEAFEATVAQQGRYAWLYDYPGVQYWKGQECSLKIVENGFGNFGYGFGLPKGSIYTEELTIAIYQLREGGFMDSLDEKWIQKTSQCNEEDNTGLDEETVEVTVNSLWGIFWIVYVGFGISFVILIMEWFWSAYKGIDRSDRKKPQTFCKSVVNRMGILKRDLLENWLPINFHRADIKRRESTIRPLPADCNEFFMRRASTAPQSIALTETQQAANGNETKTKKGPDVQRQGTMWSVADSVKENGHTERTPKAWLQ